MEIIEKLKFHENDELTEWFDTDDRTSKKFSKDLVKFAGENIAELKQYCYNTLPSEFSSLSIVYEALSEYSLDWNEFLFEEIQRVITLAKEQKIKAKYLEVLSNIESEDIYSKDEDIYIKMVSYMIDNLHVQNENKFNIELLDILNWFLMELDEDDVILESTNWVSSLTRLANDGSPSVKVKAREVLETMEVDVALNGLSFIDKVKGIFN